jgi:hypothetical protein
MHDSTSTTGLQRPRVRRGLGILVGAAICAAPLAAAPAAPASTYSNLTPQSLSSFIALLPAWLQDILSALPHTLATPLGEQAPRSGPCQSTDLVTPTLTCNVIGPAQSSYGNPPKAKIAAKLRNGKVASVRWIKR